MGENLFTLPNYQQTDPYTAALQAGVQSVLPSYGVQTPVSGTWQDPALVTTPGAAGIDWSQLLFGGKDAATGNISQGWVTGGLGAMTGLVSAYTGLQQLQVAKDNLAFQKGAFNKNYGNQVKLTNSQLEDRQRSRVMDSPGAYESVSNYMAKNGL